MTLLYNKLLGWLDTKKQPLTNALMKLTHKTLGRDLNGCRRGEALGTRLPARLSHQIYGACASRDTIRHLRSPNLLACVQPLPPLKIKSERTQLVCPPNVTEPLLLTSPGYNSRPKRYWRHILEDKQGRCIMGGKKPSEKLILDGERRGKKIQR